jgi:N-acetylneuraminic acid mutarotase
MLRVVMAALALLTAMPASARVCAGDCDGDGVVAINELVLGVSIALGALAAEACAAVDGDGDGAVTIDELIAAVDRGLSGCPQPATRWTTIEPLPQGARQEVGVTALGGRVLVIGGLTATGQTSGEVEVYDTDTGEWSRLTPLPAARHHIGVAVSGGLAYSIGGFSGLSFAPAGDVYRYDPAANEWTAVSPLPTARGALAAAEVDGRLYAVGGSGSRGSVGDHAVYDPALDEWTPLAALPDARNHLAAVALDGALYVVGGRRDGGGDNNSAALHRYDADGDRWIELAPMPTARSGHAAAVVGGRIVVMGGEINAANPPTGVFVEVEIYDPASDRWTSLEPMAVPRHGISAVTVGGLIYVPGGATRAGFAATDHADVLEIKGVSGDQ